MIACVNRTKLFDVHVYARDDGAAISGECQNVRLVTFSHVLLAQPTSFLGCTLSV